MIGDASRVIYRGLDVVDGSGGLRVAAVLFQASAEAVVKRGVQLRAETVASGQQGQLGQENQRQ